MQQFSTYIIESAKSDKYEADVADYITSLGINASRPKVSVKFPDVLIDYNGKKVWLEVKMNHTDNLGNPRASLVDGKWTAAAPLDPVKNFAIQYLSTSKETKQFVKDIAKFTGINPNSITIPSTKGLLKKPNAVSREQMGEFLANRAQYILSVSNVDLGELVTAHYLEAKAKPAFYMQAGDDFYMIGKSNPLGVPKDVPLLSGRGDFRMRIGLRTGFYEVQPEIKIMKMPDSKYSLKPGTTKLNPFKDL